MKKIAYIFSIALATLSISASAQLKNNTEDQQYPTVTKGYYSIHDNAQRLMPAYKLIQADAGLPQANKGFYSLDNNRKKLERQKTVLNTKTRRPAVIKGYYSIGNNADKLKN